MVFVSMRWLFASGGHAFCTTGGAVVGKAVSGAGVPFGPRKFVCVGIPACGPSPERAVSRAGKPESGFSLSTAPACGRWSGCCGSGRRQVTVYESDEPINAAVVFRVAGAALHRLPGETGGNPPTKCPGPGQAAVAGE